MERRSLSPERWCYICYVSISMYSSEDCVTVIIEVSSTADAAAPRQRYTQPMSMQMHVLVAGAMPSAFACCIHSINVCRGQFKVCLVCKCSWERMRMDAWRVGSASGGGSRWTAPLTHPFP